MRNATSGSSFPDCIKSSSTLRCSTPEIFSEFVAAHFTRNKSKNSARLMVTARQVTTKEDKWNGERQKRVRTGCWRRRSRGRGRRCGLRPPGSSSSRSRRWGAERAVSSCSGGRRRANPIPLSSCSAANGAITENAPVDGQNYVTSPCFEIRTA